MKYDEVISLGYDCTVARQARTANMRSKSYPLDWLVSMDTVKTFEAIENGFFGFTDIIKTKRIGNVDYYVNRYDMVFLHHSNLPYDQFVDKFEKKIESFHETLKTKNVLLIRKLHGTHEKDYCNSPENDPKRDYERLDLFQENLNKIYGKTINVEMFVSCDNCAKRHLYPLLYNPCGDDNPAYFDYISKLKSI